VRKVFPDHKTSISVLWKIANQEPHATSALSRNEEKQRESFVFAILCRFFHHQHAAGPDSGKADIAQLALQLLGGESSMYLHTLAVKGTVLGFEVADAQIPALLE
jgi:hypothetical protein